MHIAEVVTIAKSLPLLRLNTYKSLILSYSADYRRIFGKSNFFFLMWLSFDNSVMVLFLVVSMFGVVYRIMQSAAFLTFDGLSRDKVTHVNHIT